MLQRIQKIFDGVSDVCFGLSFATLAFITLLVCTDVFLRLFFDKSIPWTTEISEALILYMTFLGTEKVLRENNHVKVDILTSRVSEKVKRILCDKHDFSEERVDNVLEKISTPPQSSISSFLG